ncbi:MAG: hypothetical protein V1789_03540 [PVC group bacterium]
MIIRLRLIGPLRLPPAGRLVEWKCRKGIRVRTVLGKALGYTSKELGFIQIIRAGRPMHLDDVITGDAELQVTMRLGGG